MKWQFITYCFKYIFFNRTRQRLLFLTIIGLMLSSFSLIVLQSTMGGLQRNLVNRSKNIMGEGVLFFKKQDTNYVNEVRKFLTDELHLTCFPEYEIELLARYGEKLTYAVAHGLSLTTGVPPFLKGKDVKTGVVGVGLINRLQAGFRSQIALISPSHTSDLWGEIPRHVVMVAEDIVNTDVEEADNFHLWVRSSLIHNLIQKQEFNRMRIYNKDLELSSTLDSQFVREQLALKFGENVRLETWEEQNESLVWALKLETNVMVSLFAGMTILVGISIMSGWLIFFDKMKPDLVSFWMLGGTREELLTATNFFVYGLSAISTFLGLVLGLGVLFILDQFGLEIMPDVFLDQKIPVYITMKGILSSLGIPLLISFFFSRYSLYNFKKDQRPFNEQLKVVI